MSSICRRQQPHTMQTRQDGTRQDDNKRKDDTDTDKDTDTNFPSFCLVMVRVRVRGNVDDGGNE